jgi:hypothetical protein
MIPGPIPKESCDEHPEDRTLQSKETLLVRSLPPILPMLSIGEVPLEVTGIWSVAEPLPAETPPVQNRPIRASHGTITHPGPVADSGWEDLWAVMAAWTFGAACEARAFGLESSKVRAAGTKSGGREAGSGRE